MEKIKPKLYRTKRNSQLTDVQVRIYNSALNFHKPLEIPAGALMDYIHRLRMEGKDGHGQRNWKKFSHLPLVAFVDSESREEVVFETENDLPGPACEIRAKSDKLVAFLL
jgi:hypothetical protein